MAGKGRQDSDAEQPQIKPVWPPHGGHYDGIGPTCRRLRGGKSFVACAPQAFADPFAYLNR